MIDREVIKDFLISEFEDIKPIPNDIILDKLAEDFSVSPKIPIHRNLFS